MRVEEFDGVLNDVLNDVQRHITSVRLRQRFNYAHIIHVEIVPRSASGVKCHLPSLMDKFNIAILPIILASCFADGPAPPSVDMIGGLTFDCPTAVVTSQQVYADVVGPTCALTNCHGTVAAMNFGFSSADGMVRSWVNQPSSEAVNAGGVHMHYVTPGDVQQSYVLWKIVGRQSEVAGAEGGYQMPLGGRLVPSLECELVNWVRGGAR